MVCKALSSDIFRDMSIRYEVVLELRGEPIVDSRVATILKIVREKGSLLAAARALGIPYSRVWETIARLERVLGLKVVEAFRGGKRGGGARLTELGEKLVDLYDEACRKLEKCMGPQVPRTSISIVEPDIVVSHSHDPILSLILEKLVDLKYRVDGLCVGSGIALAMLSIGEADVACIHLYDPDKNIYNKTYLEKYWISNQVEFLGGYQRELVLALRPEIEINNIDEVLENIVRGKLRIVNRNRGSGTRVYFEYLLRKTANKLGLDLNLIKGYEFEVYTHTEAAKYVALGKADATLVLRYAAELYGLKTISVTWEKYECYTTKNRIHRIAVKKMKEILNSQWLKEIIKNTKGYKPINT